MTSGWECHDCLGTGVLNDDELCPYCEGWGWFNDDGSPRRGGNAEHEQP